MPQTSFCYCLLVYFQLDFVLICQTKHCEIRMDWIQVLAKLRLPTQKTVMQERPQPLRSDNKDNTVHWWEATGQNDTVHRWETTGQNNTVPWRKEQAQTTRSMHGPRHGQGGRHLGYRAHQNFFFSSFFFRIVSNFNSLKALTFLVQVGLF